MTKDTVKNIIIVVLATTTCFLLMLRNDTDNELTNPKPKSQKTDQASLRNPSLSHNAKGERLENNDSEYDDLTEESDAITTHNFDLAEDKELAIQLAEQEALSFKDLLEGEYSEVFTGQYRLSSDDSKVLANAAFQIEKSRIEAQYILDELEYQKSEYDSLVKEKLGEEDYAQYRAYEQNKLSDQYTRQIEPYLSDLDEQQKQDFLALTKSAPTGASIDTSAGPYGTPPSVLGSVFENNAPAQKFFIEDSSSLLLGEKEYLLSLTNNNAFQQVIEKYYDAQINEVNSVTDEFLVQENGAE